MRNVRYLLPLVALTALLAACGGGGGSAASLQGNDIAVVGSDHITTADFTEVMNQAKASYAQQNQTFPKQGTTAYQAVKTQAINLLVQRAERADEAQKLGITVTDAEIQKRLDALKKSYFKGDEKKYQAQLKKQHLTDAQVRRDLKQSLIEQKLYDKITAGTKVTNADAQLYYQQHVTDYSRAQSRDVQYMLIKKKALADSLYQQLKSGTAQQWCAAAKKYSGDPSTKNNCGKATFTKGQTVAAFDNLLFSPSAKTGVTQRPVYDPTSYKAYFLIRPLSNIKASTSTPFAQVKDSIKQTLLQQKKSSEVTTWSDNTEKQFCGGSQIKYQAGYTPTTDLCSSLTTSNATTT